MVDYGNPFLMRSGVKGVPMTAPAFTGGGYSPEIMRMATQYAKPLADQVSAYMGGKGLLETSAYENRLTKAFGQGFDRAMGDFQSQQQIYNQWARDLMAMKMQTEAEPEEMSFLQKAVPFAGLGATIGGMFQERNKQGEITGGKWAPLWGMGLGALGGLF